MAEDSDALNVKEFVSATVIQIIEGVLVAQGRAQEVGALVNPENMAHSKEHGYGIRRDRVGEHMQRYGQSVDFDMAVTAQKSGTIEGGVSVFVAPLFGGIRGKDATQDVTVSRIKFSVPVFLPEQ